MQYINARGNPEIDPECKDKPHIQPAVMTGLSWYYVNELVKSSSVTTAGELKIFEYIEEQRQKYHDVKEDNDESDFDNAICTCFLENLLNHASAGDVDYDRFIPLLGPKSREYCKAWDQFTGVRSPGLWTDEEWAQVNK